MRVDPSTPACRVIPQIVITASVTLDLPDKMGVDINCERRGPHSVLFKLCRVVSGPDLQPYHYTPLGCLAVQSHRSQFHWLSGLPPNTPSGPGYRQDIF